MCVIPLRLGTLGCAMCKLEVDFTRHGIQDELFDMHPTKLSDMDDKSSLYFSKILEGTWKPGALEFYK